MAIAMRYWVTITCDTCGKKHDFESAQLGADAVPIDWIQGAPVGEQVRREFCSHDCLANYKPPSKPWSEQ